MVKALLYIIISLGVITSYSFVPTSSNWSRHVTIELTSTHLLYNNSVGNEWSHYLLVNDQIVSEGEKSIFKLNKRAPFVIEAHAIENDKDYPDVGTKKMTFTYSDLIDIDESRFKINVQVTENGGKKAGNMAEWLFHFEIAKSDKP